MQRCPQHGLALAPDGKCVRCRQDDDAAVADAYEEAQAPARRRGLTLGVSLVALGLAIAVGAWVLSRSRAEGSAPGTAPVATTEATVAPIDAAPLAALVPAAVDASEAPTPGAGGAGGSSALEAAKRAVLVQMYCRPSARACESSLRWLAERGYSVKERDIDADPKAAAEWGSFAGNQIPAFDVDGQRIVGFDGDRLAHAVEYAAARRLQR